MLVAGQTGIPIVFRRFEDRDLHTLPRDSEFLLEALGLPAAFGHAEFDKWCSESCARADRYTRTMVSEKSIDAVVALPVVTAFTTSAFGCGRSIKIHFFIRLSAYSGTRAK